MKKKNYLKATVMFAIVLFFVCAIPKANAQIGKQAAGNAEGDAKTMAKKALKEGKIEIIDCKMEKVTDKGGTGIIKVTGTAKYTPGKLKKKPFKDIYGVSCSVSAQFYDAKGMKLPFHLDIGECGENNQEENVEYKKPFPFQGEITTDYIKKEDFVKANYCVIKGWNTVKKASSKGVK
jgi:hypothetical protein